MDFSDPLLSTVILLTAGVIGLAIAHFAHISPIVGFFVIGALIGPQAFGLIDNHSPAIHLLGELGVSFLLFDIGLHLSLKELRKGWRGFVVSGTLQFIFTTVIFSFIGIWFGLNLFSAIIVSAIFSLSSTALVLKMLSDEKEDSSPVGKRATEVLVFQDIVAILLLVILSQDLSKGISVMTLVEPLLRMIFAALTVVIVGRIALKRLFKLLISFKSDEVITAFALLLVFITSWGTQSLGLSLALGAFLGGLALSESSYSYLVRGEVAPFRSLLLSLFFLSVGMNLDLAVMTANGWLLAGLLALFIGAKIAGNWIAFRAAGIEQGLSTLLSFILAQGSEFAFVLLAAGMSAGLIDSTILSLSASLIGLSLAVTPLISSIGCFFSRSVCKICSDDDVECMDSDPKEVIIVRIDDYGFRLANILEAERIPYRAHDNDLERLSYAKSRGLNVFYSDLNRPRTLGRATLGKVLAVVSLVEDDHILFPLLDGLKKVDTSIPVIAATESPARLERLASSGVDQAFIKNDNSIVPLFETLMRTLGFDNVRIDESVARALQILEPEGLFPRIDVGRKIQEQVMPA